MDPKDKINLYLHEYNFLREDGRMLNNQSMGVLGFFFGAIALMFWYANTQKLLYLIIPLFIATIVFYIFTLRSVLILYEIYIVDLEKHINEIIGQPIMQFETKYRPEINKNIATFPGTIFYLVFSLSIIILYIGSVWLALELLYKVGPLLFYIFFLIYISLSIIGVWRFIQIGKLLQKRILITKQHSNKNAF